MTLFLFMKHNRVMINLLHGFYLYMIIGTDKKLIMKKKNTKRKKIIKIYLEVTSSFVHP